MVKPIDIHTHLSCEDFDGDREEVMKRALESCESLIDIGAGTSADASDRAKALSETYPEVFFTAGVHPHDAEKLGQDESIRTRILELGNLPKCVAMGECGLDYYYENSKPEIQQWVFEWHIKAAQDLHLPLMIHTRDAEVDTMKLLADYSGSAVFHCFTGTDELADFGVAKNFFISFSGIVTFKNAEALRKTFLRIPLQNVLIETDSPYLAPVPMRGKRNESSFLIHTASFLAGLRGMTTEDFVKVTNENTYRAFPRLQRR